MVAKIEIFNVTIWSAFENQVTFSFAVDMYIFYFCSDP